MFLKVSNVFKGGPVDYKSLNIKQFITGTQVYDFVNNFCIVETKADDVPDNPDLRVLTEEEYDTIKGQIVTPNEDSPERRIEMLEQSQSEQDDLLMKLMLGRV